jgi:hypothetical protein
VHYNNETVRQELDANWNKYCPYLLGLDDFTDTPKLDAFCQAVRERYFKDSVLDLAAGKPFQKVKPFPAKMHVCSLLRNIKRILFFFFVLAD